MTIFSSFLNPFSANSLWNSKPVNPILGTYAIPSTGSGYYPMIGPGPYSSGVFQASITDPPNTVYKISGNTGVYDSDADVMLDSITIPHWPASATGASGSDGHCDIIDEQAGVIHSFFVLKKDAAGKFTAQQYGWSPLAASGFGDGAHHYQGARATGVVASAGMIRKHEVVDGKLIFEHALACSLDKTALSATTPYKLPATRSDWYYQVNTGDIPEGVLLMLPSSYDTNRLNNWPLAKKVAETLKVYGARVVDRNESTPFVIYVENGASWSMSTSSWDSSLESELMYISTQLRQVISQSGFINGVGTTQADLTRQNVLSLRGPWQAMGSPTVVTLFDTLSQSLKLPATTIGTTWRNTNGHGFAQLDYAPKEGEYYKMYVDSDCGATMKMTVMGYFPTGGRCPDAILGPLSQYSSSYVKWPHGAWQELSVGKPANTPAGYITCRFIKITEAEYLANKT